MIGEKHERTDLVITIYKTTQNKIANEFDVGVENFVEKIDSFVPSNLCLDLMNKMRARYDR